MVASSGFVEGAIRGKVCSLPSGTRGGGERSEWIGPGMQTEVERADSRWSIISFPIISTNWAVHRPSVLPGRDSFSLTSYYKDWIAKNVERHRESNRNWWRKNTTKHKESVRKYKYGLSKPDYDSLWHYQGGRCAICRDEIPRETAHVDHDHNKPIPNHRGLLCVKCNTRLSIVEDPLWHQSALDYLARWK